MKTRLHQWQREILRATGGAPADARCYMRCVVGCYTPQIQQITPNGYVGLSVSLPRCYNDADRRNLVAALQECGIECTGTGAQK